jgi:hypothetical protein
VEVKIQTIELIQTIGSVIAAIAAAFSSYFACKAINQNRRNVFLKDINELALVVNKLYLQFGYEWESFKISDYCDERLKLLSSKHFVPKELYDEFLTVLNKLDDFEKNQEGVKDLHLELDNLRCSINLAK